MLRLPSTCIGQVHHRLGNPGLANKQSTHQMSSDRVVFQSKLVLPVLRAAGVDCTSVHLHDQHGHVVVLIGIPLVGEQVGKGRRAEIGRG
jgi:hypothetical protein